MDIDGELPAQYIEIAIVAIVASVDMRYHQSMLYWVTCLLL